MKPPAPPARTPKEIAEILIGLEGLELHFEDSGFPHISSHSTSGLDENSDDEKDPPPPEVFDAEEFEIATDAFLSCLIRIGLLRVDEKDQPPTIPDVFEDLFGGEHEIVELARHFNNHVTGYFGWICYEDMRKAFKCFLQIKKTIEAMREGDLFDTSR